MRIHKALRTTKWSLFTESFHERSWKKRGGLRNLVCFLAVSMIAGAASAQELPIQVKTQSAQRTKTKSTVITTNITDLGEGQYSTNVVTTYAFSLGGLDLADNVNALAVGVYADINGASQSNATYGGVPADGFIVNDTGADPNRMATYYWYNPSTAADQTLVYENSQSAAEVGFAIVGLSGVNTAIAPSPSDPVDNQLNNTIVMTTNNMLAVSFASYNPGSGGGNVLVAPERWTKVNQVAAINGGGTIASATRWFGKGDESATMPWVIDRTGTGNNQSVSAIAFPSYMSGADPWYLPEVTDIDVTPVHNATAVTNPVVFAATFVTRGTVFENAEFILNGVPIATTNDPTVVDLINGSTTRVYTVQGEYTFPADSKNNFSIDLATTEWSNKYDYTFTMGNAFNYTQLSPADGAVLTDFTPEVTATVIDVVEKAAVVNLYIDGEAMASAPAHASGTTTVSHVMDELDLGQTVHWQVVVTDVNEKFFTNSTSGSSFSMVGTTNRVTIWEVDDLPEQGTYDIFNIVSATSRSNNVGSVVASTNSSLGHHWTFLSATDRPAQGQTFTVPTAVGVGGFDLDSVWIKQTSYYETRDGDPANAMWFGVSGNDSMKLRITDPSKAGTDGFVVANYTGTKILNASSLTNFSGNWLQIRLPETLVLEAGKQYGFDVGPSATSTYFNMDGTSETASYPGGQAYNTGATGTGNNLMNLPGEAGEGDRAFIVQLSPSEELFTVGAVTPAGGTAVGNPVVVKVPLTEIAGTFDASQSQILIDGVDIGAVSVPGERVGDYTFQQVLGNPLPPSTSHTGWYVLASSDPVGAVSNKFTFTMDKAYTLADQLPMKNVGTNVVDVSVNVINFADSLGSAKLFLGTNELSGVSITPSSDGKTNTVKATAGGLVQKEYEAKVILFSEYEALDESFVPVTNTWKFSVRTPTDDRCWNINMAGDATRRAVADGTVVITPFSGINYWNNIRGEGGTTTKTNFHLIKDTFNNAEENVIGLISQGIMYWGSNNTGGGTISVDLFKGWVGGSDGGRTPKYDATWSITGLQDTAAYDLVLYSTWTWNENDNKFEITQGHPEDYISVKTALNKRSNAQNRANDDYSAIQEDQNYVVFRKVTPVDGTITFRNGFGVDCVINAIQIQEHEGEGNVPYAMVFAGPTGTHPTNPTLSAVFIDVEGEVTAENLVLRLDGNVVSTNDMSITKPTGSTTTTVTYVTTDLDLEIGTHEASIVAVSEIPGINDTSNSWSFYRAGVRAVPIELEHHWNFEEGAGTTVNDIVGGADYNGVIVGGNYEWVTGEDGGLHLKGGAGHGSPAWNGTFANPSDGAYVDLANGIISDIGGATLSIEITYGAVEDAASWTRVYDFGMPADGVEGNSAAWVDPSIYDSIQLIPANSQGWGQASARLHGMTSAATLENIDGTLIPRGHFVTTFDTEGRVMFAYLNGVKINSEAVTLPETTLDFSEFEDYNNFLGRSQWSHDPLYEGYIYDLRIYSGLMTQEQAQRHYEGDYSNDNPQPPTEGPAISLTVPAGGPLAISWLGTAGNNYSVMTNSDLTNPNGWGVANGTLQQGEYNTITVEFGEESSLFYKLRKND